MDKENIFDTSKQENQPQDKFADERLTEEQLDKVAGGIGGFALISLMKYITDLTKQDANVKFEHASDSGSTGH